MKPTVQALLLADHVYEDKATGKKIVAGIFQRLLFQKGGAVPKEVEHEGETRKVITGAMQAGSPFAYISLTGIRGTQPFCLRYVDLAGDQPIFQTEFQVQWDDPIAAVEIVLPLPRLPATKAGHFALELLCNEEPIGLFRIQVEELPAKGTENGNG